MSDPIRRTLWHRDGRCPLCGSILITDGRFVWCSFVGDSVAKACDYGIKERIFAYGDEAKENKPTNS